MNVYVVSCATRADLECEWDDPSVKEMNLEQLAEPVLWGVVTELSQVKPLLDEILKSVEEEDEMVDQERTLDWHVCNSDDGRIRWQLVDRNTPDLVSYIIHEEAEAIVTAKVVEVK